MNETFSVKYPQCTLETQNSHSHILPELDFCRVREKPRELHPNIPLTNFFNERSGGGKKFVLPAPLKLLVSSAMKAEISNAGNVLREFLSLS